MNKKVIGFDKNRNKHPNMMKEMQTLFNELNAKFSNV